MLNVFMLLGKAQEELVKDITVNLKGDYIIFSVYKVELDNLVYIRGWSWILKYLKIWALIKRCSNENCVNLYTPHFVNFLPNIIFSRSKKVNIYYLYDGTLNLRDVPWSDRFIRAGVIKNKLKSLLMLSRFNCVGRTINDDQLPNVKGGFFPLETRKLSLRFHGKICFIGKDYETQLDLVASHIMILEPVMHTVTDKDKVIEAVKGLCQKLKAEKVIIKTHPSINISYLFEALSEKFFVESYFGDTASAESLFQNLRPAYLAGDYSSAILNIVSKHSQVKAYSFCRLIGCNEPSLEPLIAEMERSGVIIL